MGSGPAMPAWPAGPAGRAGVGLFIIKGFCYNENTKTQRFYTTKPNNFNLQISEIKRSNSQITKSAFLITFSFPCFSQRMKNRGAFIIFFQNFLKYID